jgi:translation initiation factor 4A
MSDQNTSTDKSNSEYSPVVIETWDSINDLKPDVLRGIYAYGFEQPSPIQKKGLMPLLDRKDTIAQAQSGTGKTGCFTVATLQLVDHERPETQAILMSPTRELSRQIYDVTTALASYIDGLRVQLLVGGTSIDDDVQELRKNPPHIVIGCPGRVHDMMRRKHLNGQTVNLMILDEADDLLSHGFKEQVYNIFQYLNTQVQVGLFSATMPPELHSLSEKFMRDPVKILVKAESLTLEGIEQYYVALDNDNQKYQTLKDLFNSISVSQCIIYCNSVKRVADLHEAMTEDGYPVCCLHSNMDRKTRSESYEQFKLGKYRVLISSNVTARGIDIQQVSTVINFDIPKDVSTYLHRIGRSGRWGRKGCGINFITRRDFRRIKEIESHYATQIGELPASFVKE